MNINSVRIMDREILGSVPTLGGASWFIRFWWWEDDTVDQMGLFTRGNITGMQLLSSPVIRLSFKVQTMIYLHGLEEMTPHLVLDKIYAGSSHHSYFLYLKAMNCMQRGEEGKGEEQLWAQTLHNQKSPTRLCISYSKPSIFNTHGQGCIKYVWDPTQSRIVIQSKTKTTKPGHMVSLINTRRLKWAAIRLSYIGEYE